MVLAHSQNGLSWDWVCLGFCSSLFKPFCELKQTCPEPAWAQASVPLSIMVRSVSLPRPMGRTKRNSANPSPTKKARTSSRELRSTGGAAQDESQSSKKDAEVRLRPVCLFRLTLFKVCSDLKISDDEASYDERPSTTSPSSAPSPEDLMEARRLPQQPFFLPRF
jgi:hypothetical protein